VRVNQIVLLVLATVILVLGGCSGQAENSQGNGNNRPALAVEAVQARHGSLPLVERLSGVVEAKNQVDIYPEINSTVMEVMVDDGDSVGAGQPLVRLREIELRERLKQARAAYRISLAQAKQAEAAWRQIKTELERARALSEKGLTSEAELEDIETRALSAEADVELARARVDQALATLNEREENLSRTIVTAPVSGTVGNRRAEVGMTVNTNTRLFTLGKLDTVRIGVVLTDKMLDYVEVGQRVELHSSKVAESDFTARVSRISPFLHPVTHSTDAEIDIPNPKHNLLPGMFVTTDIYYGESEQATLVPLSALYENPASGATGVFVCDQPLEGEAMTVSDEAESIPLTEPVSFTFVPVEVIAKGRMSAGIDGVEPDKWVVTIGQDLLTGESPLARVRKVDWNRVEHLQQLQRQDLIEDIILDQKAAAKDSAA